MQETHIVPNLPLRPSDGHKGLFGKVLIIGGSRGMSGAAALAGKAALRSGAGLVRIAAPEEVVPIVAGLEPAYTTLPLAQNREGQLSTKSIGTLLDAVAASDIVAFGPGLGVGRDLRSILETLLRINKLKLVIDADGLNNLSLLPQWHTINTAELVLTPHPGEMRRLWPSVLRTDLPQDRIQQAGQFIQATRTTLVLKGAGTVVANGQSVYVNKTGNPGMATGGSGDVLTGAIAALIGQNLSLWEAAVLGTYIHGLAGDLAAVRLGQIGMTATDIIEALPNAWLSHQNKSV